MTEDQPEPVNGAVPADPVQAAIDRYAQVLGQQMNAAGEVVNGFGVLVLVNICALQVKVLGELVAAAGVVKLEDLNAALVKDIDALADLVRNKPRLAAPDALRPPRAP